MPPLTAETIKKNFADSALIYERGLSIYQTGAFVLKDSDPANGVFRYEVDGSYGDYTTQVQINGGRIKLSCSCPYPGSGCKHAVAALLDTRDILQRFKSASASVAPVRAGGFRREVASDPGTGEITTTTVADLDDDGRPGLWRFEEIDLDIGYGYLERTRIRSDDPLAAELEIESRSCVARGSWRVEIDACTRVTASRREFRVEAELRAREGDREVFARRWDERIPRQGL